jgi:hypothetical protein
MSALTDYLSSLRERGVKLWLNNGQLRYQASKGTLSTQEIARLRTMRDDIVVELAKLPVADEDHGGREARGAAIRVPVSFQQEWLLSLIRQFGTWLPAQAFAFRLTGLLETRILERSVAAVLCRHDSLRARIVSSGGRHALEIDACRAYRMDIVSTTESFAAEDQYNLRLQIPDLIAQCIDSDVGRMFHARLLKISEQKHYLILVVHRLAADCLAIGQIFRELWRHYGAALHAQPPAFATEAAQYQGYAIWQQATDAEWERKHSVYWQKYLVAAPPIQWPADDGGSCGAQGVVSLQGSFGSVLSAELREVGRQTRSLPALVVLTLYISVVTSWCRQRDFVVPFNIAGRHAAHDGVVGCFSHALYLRLTLKGDEAFEDLLQLVSNEFYKAVFHQDFGRMAMRHPHLLGGTFCQWLSWHPAELAGTEMYDAVGQLGVSAEPVRFQSARELSNVPPEVTDLDVCFFESAGDICMLLTFLQERFAVSTMERLMQQLQMAAEQIVSDSRRRSSARLDVSP